MTGCDMPLSHGDSVGMTKCLVVAVLVVGALLSSPVTEASCTTKICTGKVLRLYITANDVHLRMSGDLNQLNCQVAGTPSNPYITLHSSHPKYEKLYALLLSAHFSEADNVAVRISENTQGCKVSYVVSDI